MDQIMRCAATMKYVPSQLQHQTLLIIRSSRPFIRGRIRVHNLMECTRMHCNYGDSNNYQDFTESYACSQGRQLLLEVLSVGKNQLKSGHIVLIDE